MAIKQIAILYGKLTIPEQVMLAQLTHQPGFKVLVKMLESASEDATQDVLRVDPEQENYERLLLARQQRSRATIEFSRRVLDSIQYHIDAARNLNANVDDVAGSTT